MRDSSLVFDVPIIDITTYRKKHPELDDKEKLECLWTLDNIHDQVVAVASMFNGAIETPICDRHLTWHRGICTLYYKTELTVEEILQLSRDRVMAELVKRGLMPTRQ